MLRWENLNNLPDRQHTAFILGNHVLFAESFTCLLKTFKLFTTVVHDHQEEKLWSYLKAASVTHLFLDYDLTDINLSETLWKMKENYPTIKVIILAAVENIYLTQRLLQWGAKALLSKSTSMHDLISCLEKISLGKQYISADIKLLMDEHANVLHAINFTAKEIQVLQFIANGYTIDRTADILKVSRHTVVAHRRHMMEKTGMTSAPGLVKFGMQAGLIGR